MAFVPRFPLTIYYDASCPLCAGEMHALKKADTNGCLLLVDCSGPEFDDRLFAPCGVTRNALLQRIHARDADGRWLTGVDVFEVAYRATGFTALAGLWGNRRLRPFLDKLYPWVARRRYALSRFGLPKLFGLLMGMTKRRAGPTLQRECSDGRCNRD